MRDGTRWKHPFSWVIGESGKACNLASPVGAMALQPHSLWRIVCWLRTGRGRPWEPNTPISFVSKWISNCFALWWAFFEVESLIKRQRSVEAPVMLSPRDLSSEALKSVYGRNAVFIQQGYRKVAYNDRGRQPQKCKNVKLTNMPDSQDTFYVFRPRHAWKIRLGVKKRT